MRKSEGVKQNNDMERISNDLQVKITDDSEVDVKLVFRCWISEHHAMFPMEVEGSIWKGFTLKDFKKESKKDYEKSYKK